MGCAGYAGMRLMGQRWLLAVCRINTITRYWTEGYDRRWRLGNTAGVISTGRARRCPRCADNISRRLALLRWTPFA